MVLNGATITARGLIVGGVPRSIRDASYDLTIQDLVTPEGKIVDEYLLPAQGIVKVISAEEVKMPPDVVGYVLVKTSLCNEGVLALNIGIVDPGFEGPLQSALINFGKTDIRLHAGDVFSRISFHSLNASGTALASTFTRDNVRRSVKQDIDRFLSSTFLDIPKTAEKAAEKAFGDFKSMMLKSVPVVAVSVALLTFFLNFGNMWALYSYLKPQDQVRAELLWREADERIKKLEAENVLLRGALAQQAPVPAASQPAAKTAPVKRGKT